MKTVRLDHLNFCTDIPNDKRFNASIIESGEGYLIAFRSDWIRSEIYLARLDTDFQQTGEHRKLNLPDSSISKGKEDPRLFRIDSDLWLCWVAFSGRSTHINYAKINEQTLKIEYNLWPQNAAYNKYEKNHASFGYSGQIHAVYTIAPHVILKVDTVAPGEDPYTTIAYRTLFTGKWSGGHLRGGASPVLHDGEMWHFFHGSVKQGNGRRLYTVGLYTFSPEPPFQILRYTPNPIDVADPSLEPKAEKSDVIFPCGAICRDGEWILSHGINDRWIELRSYRKDELERKMVKHQ